MITCKCGAQFPDNTKFCSKCGSALNAGPSNTNDNSTPNNYYNANYNNPQANYQNANYNNPQGNYQNANYNNPQGNFQYGMTNTYAKIASKKPNIIGIVAGALLIISTLLPYATISFMGQSESKSLISAGDGVFFLLIGIAAIVVSIFNLNIGVLITGIVSTLFALYEVIDFSKVMDNSYYSNFVHRGVGFYLMIIASLAIIAAMPVWKIIANKKA